MTWRSIFERGIAELAAIISMSLWTRLKFAQGATPKLTRENGLRIRLVPFGIRGQILALAQPRWKVAETARGFGQAQRRSTAMG